MKTSKVPPEKIAEAAERGRQAALNCAARVRTEALAHPRTCGGYSERHASQWAYLRGALDHWADPASGFSDPELAAFVRAMVHTLNDPAASVDTTEPLNDQAPPADEDEYQAEVDRQEDGYRRAERAVELAEEADLFTTQSPTLEA